MIIKSIRLINYRNYSNQVIDFDPKLNILYGNNAQGKTNILEAIYYAARGISFKNSKESDIIKIGENGGSLKALIEINNLVKDVEIVFYQDRKKEIFVNDIPIDTLKELKNLFDVVVFSPEDLRVVKDSPKERRDFLDNLIFSVLPQYKKEKNNYDSILIERNNLLKSNQGRFFKEQIKSLNKQLSKSGAYISYIRNNFLRILNIYAQNNHKNLSKGEENLELIYKTNIYSEDVERKMLSLKDENIKDKRYEIIERIEKDFLEILDNSIDRDLEYRNTYYGIHKDDFYININGLLSKKYGSQGQMRTIMLSLRLGEIDIFRIVKGSTPILLLDDVFSELDDNRANYLILNIRRCQTIITTNTLDNLKNKNIVGKSYLINNGKVVDIKKYN